VTDRCGMRVLCCTRRSWVLEGSARRGAAQAQAQAQARGFGGWVWAVLCYLQQHGS
jgi:hypothetical protein